MLTFWLVAGFILLIATAQAVGVVRTLKRAKNTQSDGFDRSTILRPAPATDNKQTEQNALMAKVLKELGIESSPDQDVHTFTYANVPMRLHSYRAYDRGDRRREAGLSAKLAAEFPATDLVYCSGIFMVPSPGGMRWGLSVLPSSKSLSFRLASAKIRFAEELRMRGVFSVGERLAPGVALAIVKDEVWLAYKNDSSWGQRAGWDEEGLKTAILLTADFAHIINGLA